jgi:hypothetical protein
MCGWSLWICDVSAHRAGAKKKRGRSTGRFFGGNRSNHRRLQETIGKPCASANGYLVWPFFLAAFRRALSYFFIAFRCFFDIFFSTFCCCLASFRDRRIFSAVVVRWACAGIDAAALQAASSRMKVAIRFITSPNGILQRSYTEIAPRRTHEVLLL